MADEGEHAAVLDQLFAAIKNKDDSAVSRIVQQRPELINEHHDSKNGWGQTTALIEACCSDSLEIVKLLLRSGADVSKSGYLLEGCKKNRIGHYSASTGYRFWGGLGSSDDIFPLFVATRFRGELPIVLELLEAGADVNQTNATGMTALHKAMSIFDEDRLHYDSAVEVQEDQESFGKKILRVLIKHGADLNAQDFRGKTPLHCALSKHEVTYQKILVEAGANINLGDRYGHTPLETAALTSEEAMQVMLRLADYPPIEIIEAYETVALHSFTPEEYMIKATVMRRNNNLPKTVLDPIKAFGYVKEWETREELQQYHGNHGQLVLQALLARQRIFFDRGFNLFDQPNTINVAPITTHDPKETYLYALSLIAKNGEYWRFCDCYSHMNAIMSLLCGENAFIMDQDAIWTTVELVMSSCKKIQEDILESTQPAFVQEMIAQYHNTIIMVPFLMSRLIERVLQTEEEVLEKAQTTPADDHFLFRTLFFLFFRRCPFLESPLIGYRRPLAHILFDKSTRAFFPRDYEDLFPYDFFVLQMFLEHGYDVHKTDSEGNTLLHVLVSCKPIRNYEMIQLLLRNGFHLHARNNEGKTALDIMNGPSYEEWKSERVRSLLEAHHSEYDPLLKLQCIAAREVRRARLPYKRAGCLPKEVIKLVDFH